MANFSISGNIVDILHKTIFPGTIIINDGYIQAIVPEYGQHYDQYILPGFIDAHVHIESSMVVPTEFARLATVHGTVAAVCDPHEIANVMGLAGVRFMIANALKTPFTIAFGAPSCVPATQFETAGAGLTSKEIRELFDRDGISYLSEVMNVPGVLARATEVMEKIRIAQELGYPVDGHAPGLQGEAVYSYASANITTDHECSTLVEALDKLAVGMKIIIREGSAAKNFDALHSLIDSHPSQCMFCSDDKHPDDLVHGHINQLVQRAVMLGHDVMKVLQVACINPILHYNLNVGLLQVGDFADLITVKNLRKFEVLSTYCKGVLVAKAGKPLLSSLPVPTINNFSATTKQTTEFCVPAKGTKVRVIAAFDKNLITKEKLLPAHIQNGEVTADLERDVLKLTVVNRYQNVHPAVGLIQNFGLKRGAIASSVAHDSHNIVAVGTTDEELCTAVNGVIDVKGGIAVVENSSIQVLTLPIAGLMSGADGYMVAKQYAQINAEVKKLGSQLLAPFMTLSFMALLVIPDLKLSDQGLFSGKDFQFVPLWID